MTMLFRMSLTNSLVPSAPFDASAPFDTSAIFCTKNITKATFFPSESNASVFWKISSTPLLKMLKVCCFMNELIKLSREGRLSSFCRIMFGNHPLFFEGDLRLALLLLLTEIGLHLEKQQENREKYNATELFCEWYMYDNSHCQFILTKFKIIWTVKWMKSKSYF